MVFRINNKKIEEFNSSLLIEYKKLIESHIGNDVYQIPNLVTLYQIISKNEIPLDFYVENKNILDGFLSYIVEAHKKDNFEIILELESQASLISKLLSSYYINKTDGIDVDYEEILEKKKNLEKGLRLLKEQQKNIIEKNEDLIKNQSIAADIVNDLKAKNEAYNQFLDVDSNARILMLYDDIYDREIDFADKYRNWALIIFICVGVLIVFSIIIILVQNSFSFFYPENYSKINLGWDSFIKTLMLFSLTTPAWYLTRESSKHRKVAYKARMLGTELASFPLYAREFKDEDRLELRKHLADRFFGQELYSDSKTTNSNDNALEQMKLMTETNKVLAEALKAKKVLEN